MAAVLGLLTAVVFAGLSAVIPGTALAQCEAAGSERRLNLVIERHGVTMEAVAERAKPGTCNGNNLYQGQVDSKLEGWLPSVWIADGPGAPHTHYGNWDNLGQEYSHQDVNNNSYSEMWLCVEKGKEVYCGVGVVAHYSNEGEYWSGAFVVNKGY